MQLKKTYCRSHDNPVIVACAESAGAAFGQASLGQSSLNELKLATQKGTSYLSQTDAPK